MIDGITDSAFLRLLLPLVVAMPRLAGLMLGLGILQNKMVPGVVRNGVCMSIAIFVYPIMQQSLPETLPNTLPLVALLIKEFVIGLAIGYAFGLIIDVLENVGGLIDVQAGTSNAAIMDPLSGHQIGPSSAFLKQFAISLFVMSGIMAHLFVQTAKSYTWWQWDAMIPSWPQFDAKQWLLNQTGTFWELSARIAAPVVIVLLLAEIGLGLINRITPQFDVMAVAMPVKVVLAVLVIALSLVFWSETLLHFFTSVNLNSIKQLGEMPRI
jgi:type III secretion protein T